MHNVAEQEKKYAAELQSELLNILSYWMDFTPDDTYGGFVGRIDQDNIIDETAAKGAVLHARILWSFAAAYNQNPLPEYLEHAGRAYHYIVDHLIDHEFGGVYWSADPKGNPLDTKKKIYTIAYTIYAMSEFFMASGKEVAKDHAVALYKDLIRYGLDKEKGGYFEAFGQQWELLDESKTMNTQLHVLEGLTNLYRIWPDQELKLQLVDLLANFRNFIVNADTGHLTLLFDEDWARKSDTISYGHDIEASWLLQEAAEVTGEAELIDAFKVLALKMSTASLEGLDADGGMWYTCEPASQHVVREKHWWVQAEAMLGFYNAWELSGEEKFFAASMGAWTFVKNRIIDRNNGEWFWGIGADDQVMPDEDKTGPWKCPYHNSRACIEIIKRTA
ncbi:N-acyl-D-glucosamine 2-epimerase [Pedobacter sp. HMWF019]|nr:N-acyl-D-glucosamine 2-epimerase [Pedobacter sp. HMWF019]